MMTGQAVCLDPRNRATGQADMQGIHDRYKADRADPHKGASKKDVAMVNRL